MRTIALIASLYLSVLTGAWAQPPGEGAPPRIAAPEGAEVYFQAPADGAQVRSPFVVRFGLRGMGVAPAGVQNPNTGHHHLLVDVDELPDPSLPLPATDNVIHFGMGQTETELDLPPGQHTLQLVLGDWLHRPHLPPVQSERITITVVE